MAGRKSSAANIKMPDVNTLFGLGQDSGEEAEKVMEVAIGKLYPFKSHPFKVLSSSSNHLFLMLNPIRSSISPYKTFASQESPRKHSAVNRILGIR